MWFRRKSKEEKQVDLVLELANLEEKYRGVINSYCAIGTNIFIFLGFRIKDDKIKVIYRNEKTPKGMETAVDISWWDLKYGGTDFHKYRADFILFVEGLGRIGLEIRKQNIK
jgi:hypothetical protein